MNVGDIPKKHWYIRKLAAYLGKAVELFSRFVETEALFIQPQGGG